MHKVRMNARYIPNAVFIFFRVVKSDRAIILLNLCIALIIGYALFLGGVSQADQKVCENRPAVFLCL